MRILYNNINPNKLQDELIAIGIVPLLVENNCPFGKYIAEKTWITFADDADMTKINEVVVSHNPTPIIVLTPEETITSKLLKDNVNIQLQLVQQQKINANLLTQISKLGGAR